MRSLCIYSISPNWDEVGGEGLEQVIRHSETDTRRGGKRGHSCLPFDKARHGVFI